MVSSVAWQTECPIVANRVAVPLLLGVGSTKCYLELCYRGEVTKSALAWAVSLFVGSHFLPFMFVWILADFLLRCL